MNPSLEPRDAWERLPDQQWNAEAARHLLRRAGWAATPVDVERASGEGLERTLDRLFPATVPRLPQPPSIAALAEDTPAFVRKLSVATGEGKRALLREARERAQIALQDLSIKWLEFAARPENAASAKWVFFLGDVYVVASEKVKNPALIWQHFDLLSQHAFGPAPALTKAVSRSPAMIRYLDLNESKRGAPNENFARELFELFILGEGNYSEQDIKEAARAFTGYRTRFGEYFFAARQHDAGTKTIFGHTGYFSGDAVIDLAYQQKAVRTFLPHELVKFYLSDTPLSSEFTEPLGDWWAGRDYDLRALALKFFGSRLFFAPEYSAHFIKSPVQFYLGLVQDLQLDVVPIPRRVLIPLRQMCQMLYNPPNVRGWIGGRSWINSATLAARCQMVESLFEPIHEEYLNADEQRTLEAARAGGAGKFTVANETLAEFASDDSAQAAGRLLRKFLGQSDAPEFRADLREFLLPSESAPIPARLRLIRRAAIAVLQSPEYQLC